jgi:hypothetical protein
LYLLYRVGLVLTSLVSFFHDASERVQKSEALLLSVSTNHLPHMQVELETINRTLLELREDFRLVLFSKIRNNEKTE